MGLKRKKYGVFISYSHFDEGLVSPIVSLISSLRKDLVFQDNKALKPGKKWEPELMKALDEAEVVIVFWCRHASKSKYVRKEYENAILAKKDILPVLLDDSRLNKLLKQYQGIDLKNIIAHEVEEKTTRKHYIHGEDTDDASPSTDGLDFEFLPGEYEYEEEAPSREPDSNRLIADKIAGILKKKLPIRRLQE